MVFVCSGAIEKLWNSLSSQSLFVTRAIGLAGCIDEVAELLNADTEGFRRAKAMSQIQDTSAVVPLFPVAAEEEETLKGEVTDGRIFIDSPSFDYGQGGLQLSIMQVVDETASVSGSPPADAPLDPVLFLLSFFLLPYVLHLPSLPHLLLSFLAPSHRLLLPPLD